MNRVRILTGYYSGKLGTVENITFEGVWIVLDGYDHLHLYQEGQFLHLGRTVVRERKRMYYVFQGRLVNGKPVNTGVYQSPIYGLCKQYARENCEEDGGASTCVLITTATRYIKDEPTWKNGVFMPLLN